MAVAWQGSRRPQARAHAPRGCAVLGATVLHIVRACVRAPRCLPPPRFSHQQARVVQANHRTRCRLCIKRHGCASAPTASAFQTTRTATPTACVSLTGSRTSLATRSRSAPASPPGGVLAAALAVPPLLPRAATPAPPPPPSPADARHLRTPPNLPASSFARRSRRPRTTSPSPGSQQCRLTTSSVTATPTATK